MHERVKCRKVKCHTTSLKWNLTGVLIGYPPAWVFFRRIFDWLMTAEVCWQISNGWNHGHSPQPCSKTPHPIGWALTAPIFIAELVTRWPQNPCYGLGELIGVSLRVVSLHSPNWNWGRSREDYQGSGSRIWPKCDFTRRKRAMRALKLFTLLRKLRANMCITQLLCYLLQPACSK